MTQRGTKKAGSFGIFAQTLDGRLDEAVCVIVYNYHQTLSCRQKSFEMIREDIDTKRSLSCEAYQTSSIPFLAPLPFSLRIDEKADESDMDNLVIHGRSGPCKSQI